MTYEEELASRLRALLSELDRISERRMFGGLSFLRDGNLVCGVMDDTLLARLGEAQARAALADPHVRLMDLQRRPSRGTRSTSTRRDVRTMPRCGLGRARARLRRDAAAEAGW